MSWIEELLLKRPTALKETIDIDLNFNSRGLFEQPDPFVAGVPISFQCPGDRFWILWGASAVNGDRADYITGFISVTNNPTDDDSDTYVESTEIQVPAGVFYPIFRNKPVVMKPLDWVGVLGPNWQNGDDVLFNIRITEVMR